MKLKWYDKIIRRTTRGTRRGEKVCLCVPRRSFTKQHVRRKRSYDEFSKCVPRPRMQCLVLGRVSNSTVVCTKTQKNQLLTFVSMQYLLHYYFNQMILVKLYDTKCWGLTWFYIASSHTNFSSHYSVVCMPQRQFLFHFIQYTLYFTFAFSKWCCWKCCCSV